MYSKISEYIEKCIEDRAFSGAQLLVFKENHIIFEESFGTLCFNPPSCAQKKVSSSTLFDLASLTKPLATLFLVLKLFPEKFLNQKVSSFVSLPHDVSSDPEKEEITVFHLLNHSSGLPAWKPYFLELLGKKFDLNYKKNFYVGKIWSEKLKFSPGKGELYSDLGYILLGFVIEKLMDAPLFELFETHICKSVEICDELLFLPVDRRSGTKHLEIAATETCPYRKKVIMGEVHDLNSWVLNGVTGHAGLFGTARGVFKVLKEFLNGYYGGSELFSVRWYFDYVLKMLQKQSRRFVLGFDTPSEKGSMAGRYFSRFSVGHLGFTGTSFWVDIEKKIGIIFLTNRVHSDPDGKKIRKIRPFLHDTVFETFFKKEIVHP